MSSAILRVAQDFLQSALTAIQSRASERDQAQERSMRRAVATFNAPDVRDLAKKLQQYVEAVAGMSARVKEETTKLRKQAEKLLGRVECQSRSRPWWERTSGCLGVLLAYVDAPSASIHSRAARGSLRDRFSGAPS